MLNIKSNIKKSLLIILIAMVIVAQCSVRSSATSNSELSINGEIYQVTVEESDLVNHSQLLKDGNVVAEATFNKLTGELVTVDYIRNKTCKNIISESDLKILKQTNFSSSVSSDYSYITTHKGNMNVAGLGTAALCAAIVALVPGAGIAVATVVAGEVIRRNLDKIYYTVDLYQKHNGGKSYTFKRVFKVFEKSGGSQIGSDIVGYSTVHK